jgi:hypothetical protein
LSDILVERATASVAFDRQQSACATVGNAFTTLVKRAEQDGVLAEEVGMRTTFRRGSSSAFDAGERSGAEAPAGKSKPETQAETAHPRTGHDEVAAKAAPRNYTTALRQCAPCTKSISR